jgi:nucleoside 2-deoxyribosyltransferase
VKAYIAAPLFSAPEREQNLTVDTALQDIGLDTYLPQRDSNESLPPGDADLEIRRRIFEDDIAAIHECDLFIIILDGRVPDEGACMELGVAYTLGKPCFGLQTDSRYTERPGSNNLMIELALIDGRPVDSVSKLTGRIVLHLTH